MEREKSVIDQIQNLVMMGNVSEAKELVSEYKAVYGSNDEIESIDAIINFYDGNYDEALNNIRQGLEYNILNSDLYYTMGNIYEALNDYNRSFLCYEKALFHCNNDDNKTEIVTSIDNLKKNCHIEVKDTSFVLFTQNDLSNIKKTIKFIKKYCDNDNYEIIIFDDNSSDGTLNWIKNQNNIYLYNCHNEDLNQKIDKAICMANSSNDVMFLSSDTKVLPNSVFNMRMALYSQKDVCAAKPIYINNQEIIVKNNIPNSNDYEYTNEAEGIDILIKRTNINKINFSNGKRVYLSEDKLEKNKIIICKDAWIDKVSQIDDFLKMIDKSIDKSNELLDLCVNLKYAEFQSKVYQLHCVLENINNIIHEYDIDKSTTLTLSAINSLKDIAMYAKTRNIKVSVKIEFELIPLLELLKSYVFYFEKVCDTSIENRMEYYKKTMPKLCSNKFIDKYQKTGQYKYDLSIVVLAYNKLEYTKICVQSILDNMPQDINYELILVNHGSSDGTREFFEKLAPTKQIDISENGLGLLITDRIIEGRLFICISNDIIILKNSIENMIKCVNSDEKIGCVVPSTPNIANCQNIDLEYSDFDQLKSLAEINNVSNPKKWEQRVRLCNPVTAGKSELFFGSKGIVNSGYYVKSGVLSFPDDRMSLLLRRRGYKLVLAKDSYCYHYGSVTIGRESQVFYDEGRKDFMQLFGVDPWGKGALYDINLLNNFKQYHKDSHKDIRILGIDCGIGASSLMIKEYCRQKSLEGNILLTNITSEYEYIDDLKGISDCVYRVKDDSIKYKSYDNEKYDYIVMERDNINDYKKICRELKNCLAEDGIIYISNLNDDTVKHFNCEFKILDKFDKWTVICSK